MNYADKKEKLEEEVSEKGATGVSDVFGGRRTDDWWSVAGVRVFVEPKALFHVVGTTMDFQVRPPHRCKRHEI